MWPVPKIRKSYVIMTLDETTDSKKSETLVKSQWQKGQKSVKFLLFRWTIAIYFIVGISISWAKYIARGTLRFWPIYLTNWALTLGTAATVYSAILTTRYYYRKKENFHSCEILRWLLNVSIIAAFEVSILNHVQRSLRSHGSKLILNFELSSNNYLSSIFLSDEEYDLVELWVHVGNSMAMLLEIAASSYIFKFSSCIHPALVGVIYACFTVIYFIAGGVDSKGNRFVYPIMNWETPTSSGLSVVGATCSTILSHFMLVYVQKFRRNVSKKVFVYKFIGINNDEVL